MDRLTEVVTLSDGRKVTMQEMSTFDQIAAKKTINAKDVSDYASLPETLICFAIAEIDGKKFSRPYNSVGVQSFFANIKLKDYAKLDKAYKRLNDDEEGETPAADSE